MYQSFTRKTSGLLLNFWFIYRYKSALFVIVFDSNQLKLAKAQSTFHKFSYYLCIRVYNNAILLVCFNVSHFKLENTEKTIQLCILLFSISSTLQLPCISEDT